MTDKWSDDATADKTKINQDKGPGSESDINCLTKYESKRYYIILELLRPDFNLINTFRYLAWTLYNSTTIFTKFE